LDLMKSLKKEGRFFTAEELASLATFMVKGLIYLHARGLDDIEFDR
jgi:hypothetical protein